MPSLNISHKTRLLCLTNQTLNIHTHLCHLCLVNYHKINYYKKGITNIHIKPTYIDSDIIKSVLNGFLHRTHSICYEKYIKEEEKVLIDVLVENGHNKQLLENFVVKCNNKNKNKNNHENNTENRE